MKKTMKIIDLLVKIANGEKVPKKVKVLDLSLFPEYRIITWNENLKQYEYYNGCEFDRVLDKFHLETYVEIIEEKEDTPKASPNSIRKYIGLPLQEDRKLPKKLDIELNGDDENKVNCYRATNLECDLALKINGIIEYIKSKGV